MANGHGGKREGGGRKPDKDAQKLRADLNARTPKALKAIDEILASSEHPQHAMMAKWLVDKVAANLKPESAPIALEFPANATTVEKCEHLIDLVGRSEISPTAASELIKAMTDMARLKEFSELEGRLSALESR